MPPLVDGPYTKTNVRWADPATQTRNQRPAWRRAA